MGDYLLLDQAIAHRNALRRQGKTLVFTNGHFDLLHVGHLDYLERARALGHALFIGVNGDQSTRRLKGEGRPLVPAMERARLLAALAPVTAVLIFEADTATALIEALQPDVYAKGGDYGSSTGGKVLLHKPLPELPAIQACGGRVALLDYLPGYSTSDLIARVKALP